ncbi:MAG: hypothetical protein HYV27_12380 [Candidatus Hydrogenedentes bacterium]|nr:hypothetical protein [Candidatus Hydrogenedentota bacterium]
MNYRVAAGLIALGVFTAGCSKPADTGASPAATPTGEATFASTVQPIVGQRCAKCHVDDSKGGLSLATLESALAGGKKGAAIAPGNADGSLLFQMVAGTAEKRMPPKGDPLSGTEIATIKAWIDGGAH